MTNTSLSPAQLAAYFNRIGYAGTPTCNLATLRALHKLHPLAIGFENLDSWCGTVPSLDADSVYRKLVEQGRGGYCYEHNQLFNRVLQTLGFRVYSLAARVVLAEDPPLPRTHKVLLVRYENSEWLVDVGFGGMTLTAPLSLSQPNLQSTSHEPWRVQQREEHYLISAMVRATWSPMYQFSMELQTPADYEMGNWYVAAHPTSRFRNNLIAARVSPEGRHALFNTRYHYHRQGQDSIEQVLQSPDELQQLLQTTFGFRTVGITALQARIAGLFTNTDS